MESQAMNRRIQELEGRFKRVNEDSKRRIQELEQELKVANDYIRMNHSETQEKDRRIRALEQEVRAAADAISRSEPETKKCQRCESIMPASATFCTGCNQPLATEPFDT